VRPSTALREALAPLDEDGTALLAAVAHQLRTPLTSVAGYLELLGDALLGPLTEDQRQVLETMGGSVQRLSELIDELDPCIDRERADQG
jgi:signal transduction histidine kinase